MSGGALLAGYAADLITGDPRRWHPVAGFGRTAWALERAAYAPSRRRGAVVTGVLVAGTAVAVATVAARCPEATLAAVTWAALGGRSLRKEARALATLIEQHEIPAARAALSALCGWDAAGLDAHDLTRAVVESLAENTSDAVVGALAWGAVMGPAGVAAYRAANTLDAMFGHRSERYADFGHASAKLDDAMNWPAARISSAITCLAAPLVGGSPGRTLAAIRRDGGAHPSPNAGRIESAFAGALGIRLGGPVSYRGHVEPRPVLGDGRRPDPNDIRRASRLSFSVSTCAALACAGVRAGLQRARSRR